MKITTLSIPEVVLIEPRVFTDDRGSFFESFNQAEFENTIGRKVNFVQDNQSKSIKNVLRGMHYQIKHPQGKLVRVALGEVFDVAVDLRKNSPTFGRWVGAKLSADNNLQLWIPEGFAHGFIVLSEIAIFQYKVTDYWCKEADRCLRYDDLNVGIDWPIKEGQSIIISEKDKNGAGLLTTDLF